LKLIWKLKRIVLSLPTLLQQILLFIHTFYSSLTAMGKTKWYSEPETPVNQQHNTSKTGANRVKQNYYPGQALRRPRSVQEPTLGALLHDLRLRLRPWLIALRFHFNRRTFGLLRERAVLKLGVLAVFGFYVFKSDELPVFSNAAGMMSETPFGVTGESDKKKKVGWSTKNEAAPVSSKELSVEMAEDYIERFNKIAREEMVKYGIPASISLAQGLVESRAGHSKLAVNNNNHFGIKCFSRKCGKGHCSNFTDDTHKDFFRKFASPWESWRAHSIMLSSGRYKSLRKYGRDYRQWAFGLKSIGYATDRTYAEKLVGMIERYDLQRFDK
jgi:flagellum-specific peptidoglycan hydrolase FlgJ